jgi:glucose-1-phosphate thymidylyltransferase
MGGGSTVAGVIPAAGYATRLQPLSCSKEILPINGRPVMDYVIDRMRLAGCTEVRVVTRPDKTDVIAHAEEVGATVVLARPATPGESFVAGMEGLAPDDVVLIGWPDTLWEPDDGYVPLVDAVERGQEIALGLFRTPDLQRSDVLSFDDSGRVTGIHIKPADPPSAWIWGCAAARARALAGLEREEWPGSFFNSLCERGFDLHVVRLSDVWLDIGTKEALERARNGPSIQ